MDPPWNQSQLPEIHPSQCAPARSRNPWFIPCLLPFDFQKPSSNPWQWEIHFSSTPCLKKPEVFLKPYENGLIIPIPQLIDIYLSIYLSIYIYIYIHIHTYINIYISSYIYIYNIIYVYTYYTYSPSSLSNFPKFPVLGSPDRGAAFGNQPSGAMVIVMKPRPRLR